MKLLAVETADAQGGQVPGPCVTSGTAASFDFQPGVTEQYAGRFSDAARGSLPRAIHAGAFSPAGPCAHGGRMPASMRTIGEFCADCDCLATYEVLDWLGKVWGSYCVRHAVQKVRQLDAAEEQVKAKGRGPSAARGDRPNERRTMTHRNSAEKATQLEERVRELEAEVEELEGSLASAHKAMLLHADDAGKAQARVVELEEKLDDANKWFSEERAARNAACARVAALEAILNQIEVKAAVWARDGHPGIHAIQKIAAGRGEATGEET